MSALRRTSASAIVSALTLVAACGPKGSAADRTADSTAVVAPADSGTKADSTAADPSERPDSVMSQTPTKATTGVGRDSAFGPRFLVDSTGKLTRIPEKKRP
jgi:hypothetical protein